MEYDKFEFTSQEYYDYIFFQKSSFVIEESIIHWQNFINPILLYIQNSLRCTVISTFNDLVLHADYMSKSNPSKYISDWSNLDDLNIIPILDDSLHEIIWDNENSKYIRFLENNNYYKNGEDVHYKFGVQEELSKEWIKRLDSQFNLSEKYNKKTLL